MDAPSAADEIQALLAELIEWLRGVDPELLYLAPAASEWTVMELLAHMTEFLRHWANEAVAVAAEPGRTFGRGEDDAERTGWVAAHGADPLDVMTQDLTAAGDYARARLLAIPASGWGAMGVHPTMGAMALPDMVTRVLTSHLADHLDQARAAYAALIGAARD
jgi:hypothetical protein